MPTDAPKARRRRPRVAVVDHAILPGVASLALMLSVILGLLVPPPAPAQALAQVQLTPKQLRHLNSRLANQVASTIAVFSSADLIATGEFHYDNEGPDDPEFSTYKLPLSHTFGPETNRFRPFISGYVGYFSLHEDVTALGPPAGNLDIESLALTAGGGIAWQATEWLTISPRFLSGYVRLSQDYDRAALPGDPTAGLVVDWDADGVTLLPSLSAAGSWTNGPLRFGLVSTYTFVSVLEVSASSDLVRYGSESHVWRNEASVRWQTPWAPFRLPMAITPLFARHDIAGYLKESGFVDHFHEARLTLSFGLPARLQPVREVGLSGAWFFGGPLTGYSIGVSLGF